MLTPHKMSRCFLALLAGTMLSFSMPALACEEGGPDGPGGKAMHMGPPKTLAEAKERAKKRLDMLNGMSEEDWRKHQQERAGMKEKWQSMTPEQKAAAKDKMMQMHQNHDGMGMKPPAGGDKAPPPGGAN